MHEDTKDWMRLHEIEDERRAQVVLEKIHSHEMSFQKHATESLVRFTHIEAVLKLIQSSTGDLKVQLFGNGRAGLMEKTDKRLDALEKIVISAQGFKHGQKALWGLFGALIGALGSLLAFLPHFTFK